jgi:hypothetical protein
MIALVDGQRNYTVFSFQLGTRDQICKEKLKSGEMMLSPDNLDLLPSSVIRA